MAKPLKSITFPGLDGEYEVPDIPVPISQGGTGATNDSDARGNLKVPRIDLLWTNASPNSEFPAQTLSLGLNNYAMYIVLAKNFKDTSNAVCAIGRTGYGIRLNTIGALDTGYHEVRRTVDYATGGGLKFYDVYRNGTVNGDGYLIPYFIYGIRGVQY